MNNKVHWTIFSTISYDAINTYEGKQVHKPQTHDDVSGYDSQQTVSTREHGESWRNLMERIVSF